MKRAASSFLRLTLVVLATSRLSSESWAALAPVPIPGGEAARALRTGRYQDALKLAQKRLARAAADVDATLVAARAESALGRIPDARRRLEQAIAARPEDWALKDALMRLYEAVGDRKALAAIVDEGYLRWNEGRVDRTRAADLIAVATAVRLDGNWKDANDVLRDAVRADRHGVAANLDWGYVLLEKHNAPDAAACFRDVLKLEPDNPDARVGLARVMVDDHYDVASARDELARALAVNPVHAGALALRAELALDAEDWAAARADVAALRRTNPNDRGAARIAAAAALLADDRAGYERAREQALAIHPSDGGFYAFVTDALVRHRRYDDARDVANTGVEADPDDASCLQALATTLLRLGDEGAGLETLRRAWKRDPYDVRTFNLLNLFEKAIPAHTTMIASAHLAYRVPAAAKPAIELVVAPFLEERYRDYVARYGFSPKGPVTFELYGDPREFAVRTVGMPTIGVAGVCFGRIITSQAPTNHAFNWGMVLAHELAHVFAIELSRSRVPRWFTEGLSEVETMRLRPEWSRHDDIALWGAWRRNELPPLTSLSTAFASVRSAEESARHYAHAALAVDFLERRFGFAAIRAALAAYGRGERDPAVLERLAGMPADALERAFRADLASRFARYETQYLPTQTAVAPVRLALAAVAAGDLDPARRLLDKLIAPPAGSDKNRPRAPEEAELAVHGFLAGELALARKDAPAAVDAFSSLLALKPPRDGYDVRVRLALAEIQRHRTAEAEGHLRRAAAFDPSRLEPHALLAELYRHENRPADRLTALAAAVELDPQTDRIAKEVVLGSAKAGRTSRVLELAPIAIFIDPAAPDVHAALGRALAGSGKTAAAAAALERALAFGAPDASALHLSLAGLYDTLGNRGRADAHRAAARR